LKQFSMDRDDIDLPTAEHTFDDRKPDKVIYSTKPQILVVTSDELAPLFVNVGCEAITKINDSTKMTSDVQDVIASEPSIKVVLIEGEHNEDLIKQLRKSLRGDILISGLSLPTHQTLESNQKTYFDQIARSTLGVRLD